VDFQEYRSLRAVNQGFVKSGILHSRTLKYLSLPKTDFVMKKRVLQNVRKFEDWEAVFHQRMKEDYGIQKAWDKIRGLPKQEAPEILFDEFNFKIILFVLSEAPKSVINAIMERNLHSVQKYRENLDRTAAASHGLREIGDFDLLAHAMEPAERRSFILELSIAEQQLQQSLTKSRDLLARIPVHRAPGLASLVFHIPLLAMYLRRVTGRANYPTLALLIKGATPKYEWAPEKFTSDAARACCRRFKQDFPEAHEALKQAVEEFVTNPRNYNSHVSNEDDEDNPQKCPCLWKRF
jgi:hypothetical protein